MKSRTNNGSKRDARHAQKMLSTLRRTDKNTTREITHSGVKETQSVQEQTHWRSTQQTKNTGNTQRETGDQNRSKTSMVRE